MVLARSLHLLELALPLDLHGVKPAEDLVEGRLDVGLHESLTPLKPSEVGMLGDEIQDADVRIIEVPIPKCQQPALAAGPSTTTTTNRARIRRTAHYQPRVLLAGKVNNV
jgi:hypothetical protein